MNVLTTHLYVTFYLAFYAFGGGAIPNQQQPALPQQQLIGPPPNAPLDNVVVRVFGNQPNEFSPRGIDTPFHLNGSGFNRLFPIGVPFGPDSMDGIVDAMFRDIDHNVHSQVLPPVIRISQNAEAANGYKHPCAADVERLCKDEVGRSRIHCLGTHADKISPTCKAEVEKSVPFICSVEISALCDASKTMETSVLECLLKNQAVIKNEDCLNSVSATKSLLTRLETHTKTAQSVDILNGNEIVESLRIGGGWVKNNSGFLIFTFLILCVIGGVLIMLNVPGSGPSRRYIGFKRDQLSKKLSGSKGEELRGMEVVTVGNDAPGRMTGVYGSLE